MYGVSNDMKERETRMAEFDVDLFVIGAGSGGVRAGRIAAQYGAKVMVAEEFRIGGTCVIRGCVPKKLMVYASRFKDDFEDAAGFGWTVPRATFDWRKLVTAKEAEITRLSGIYRTNLAKAGAKLIETRAEIVDPHKVRLQSDGRVISARTILVATGGHPSALPGVKGIEHAITSNEIFDLPKFPKRLMIVGGGYIAVEFASIFARLGSAVTLVMRGDNVLRGFDEDLRVHLRDGLVAAGVSFAFGTLPAAIEKRGENLSVTLADKEVFDVDQIMIATGRRPNTTGLGLENVDVALDAVGAVKVDSFSQSNVASIYAIGDVTNRLALTPVAIREGHAFADTVFGGRPTTADHVNVPTAVFTTPEIGTVGMTEAHARAEFACVDIYAAHLRPMKAMLSGRPERTFLKIVVDGETDKVLGVHILGHDAGEMAQILGIAVKMGATKADFDSTVALHPTMAEELVTMRTRTARYVRDADPKVAAAQ
jgi:glutathione reductase (NADPH)